jgi:hypothetical protein
MTRASLRERVSEIEPLARYFVAEFCRLVRPRKTHPDAAGGDDDPASDRRRGQFLRSAL